MLPKHMNCFSKDKHPVEVAFILHLKEPEVTRMFIEYCKLKRLHKFYLAYKELGDNGIGYFEVMRIGKERRYWDRKTCACRRHR